MPSVLSNLGVPVEAALKYREYFNWNAIPLCPHDHVGVGKYHLKVCSSPGKVPILPMGWKPFQKMKIPERLLLETFTRHPYGNVGVILGETSDSLVAVDVDGKDASQYLKTSIARGLIAPTASFRTGGGYRLLYKLPRGSTGLWSNRRGQPPSGRGEVLLMGQGKQTVMPTSIHPLGKMYTWANLDKGLQDVAEAPDWLLDWKPKASDVQAVRGALQSGQPITEGRNPLLFKIGCAMRRHGCTVEEIYYALEKVNKRCIPPKTEAELLTISKQAGRYVF
jgi:bifunctional DNA primase/polymerase-like protein/primase-like protein